MKRSLPALAASVAVILAIGGTASAELGARSAKAVRLAEATMIVEVNATDGDAGL